MVQQSLKSILKLTLLTVLLTVVGRKLAWGQQSSSVESLMALTGGQAKLYKTGRALFSMVLRVPEGCEDLKVEDQQDTDTVTLNITIPDSCHSPADPKNQKWLHKRYDFETLVAGVNPRQIGFTLKGQRRLFNWNKIKVEETEASACIECEMRRVEASEQVEALRQIPLRSDIVRQEAEYGVASSLRDGELSVTGVARAATLPWLRSEVRGYSDTLRKVVESVTVTDSRESAQALYLSDQKAQALARDQMPASLQKSSDTTFSLGDQIGVRVQSKNQAEGAFKYEVNLRQRIYGDGQIGEIGARFSTKLQKNFEILGEARSEFGGVKRAGILLKLVW